MPVRSGINNKKQKPSTLPLPDSRVLQALFWKRNRDNEYKLKSFHTSSVKAQNIGSSLFCIG